MKRSILIIVLISLYSYVSLAGFVKYEHAAKVANAHYYSSLTAIESVDMADLSFDCVSNPSLRSAAFKFYVFDFNVLDNKGYVIVSSDDNIKPILAYSLEDNFDADNIPPAFKMFLDYFDACIEDVSLRANTIVDESISNQWNYLLNYDFAKTRTSTYTSPNLLDDIGIKWNQMNPYNAMCPVVDAAKGTHVPVGCVAISAAQVMKYYNWPPSGERSKTHKTNKYGEFTVNFSQENYNWDAIPLAANNNRANDELAKICFQLGVALDMNWGPKGSGAYTHEVADILKKYFRYSNNTKFISKSSYSTQDWIAILKTEIDAKRPMVYKGQDNSDPQKKAGHAWNCDGYEIKEDGVTFFHMNWGWGGAGNNYCTLDKLISKATGNGPQNNFVSSQGIVRNIYPEPYQDNPYPKHMAGTREIRGQEGSFDDGSGSENYQKNAEALYVIKPSTCGSIIDIKFVRFDLAEGDELFIYSGEGETKKLVNQLNSLKKPNDKDKFTGENAITLKFVTKNVGGADGWIIDYKVSNCSSQSIVFSETSGVVNDGSGQDCFYTKSTDCRWFIKPDNANRIKIDFTKFDLADDDYVELFKGPSTSAANSIAKLSNENIPTESIIVIDTVVAVRFKVNFKSQGADGWQFSYSSTADNSIKEEKQVSDMEIIQNPGTNESPLILSTEKFANLKVSIYNVVGSLFASKEFALEDGSYEYRIKDIADQELESGVYFITLMSDNKLIVTRKFILVK